MIECTRCHKENFNPKYKLCPKCRYYFRDYYKGNLKEKNNNLYCRYCHNKLNTEIIFIFNNQVHIYCKICKCFLSQINIYQVN